MPSITNIKLIKIHKHESCFQNISKIFITYEYNKSAIWLWRSAAHSLVRYTDLPYCISQNLDGIIYYLILNYEVIGPIYIYEPASYFRKY